MTRCIWTQKRTSKICQTSILDSWFLTTKTLFKTLICSHNRKPRGSWTTIQSTLCLVLTMCSLRDRIRLTTHTTWSRRSPLTQARAICRTKHKYIINWRQRTLDSLTKEATRNRNQTPNENYNEIKEILLIQIIPCCSLEGDMENRSVFYILGAITWNMLLCIL